MPRHSPCALVRLNFLYSVPAVSLLNCLSFINNKFNFGLFLLQWKGFILFFFESFIPPFGEIVVILPKFGKTLIDLTNLVKSIIVLLSVRFLLLHLYSVFNEHNFTTLSYSAKSEEWIVKRWLPFGSLVGSSGLEPPTSRLSGARSNHLSYEPVLVFFGVSRSSCSPLVEMKGIEPLTPCLQGRCSPSWATPPCVK